MTRSLSFECPSVGNSDTGNGTAEHDTRQRNESGQEPRRYDFAACRTDRQLVDRCVAGNVQAWKELHQLGNESLLRSVRYMIAQGSRDANLVEEIAARVWYALVANDAELLDRYDPSHGARIVTYLRVLARDEIKRYFRSESRRRQRELKYSSLYANDQRDEPELVPSIDEFSTLLTPSERRFFDNQLVSARCEATEQEAAERSPANKWQLTHRIRTKLLQFLDLGA